ncbi:MAG: lipopolysaccharide heptosyltransferase I [Pyrinomonadaceae bacterium]
MRILLVKLSSIGDIVHTLPTLAAIRRALPNAEISWVVETRSAEILRGNTMIDRLIEVDTRALRSGSVVDDRLLGVGRQLRGLRETDYDIAIDFQGLIKSAMIAKLSGAKRRVGFATDGLREPMSRFLLTDHVPIPPRIHVIKKNLTLAAGALGIDMPAGRFEFPVETTAAQRAEANALTTQTEGNFAVLNPGGGWVTKLWPAENFGELADHLWREMSITPILTTGPNENDLAARALAASKTGKLITAQPSLKGFYELAKRARIYIGGDTGPTHIAVAAGTAIVGLFGPTEWWRNGSPNPDDISIERPDTVCRIDCHRRTCSAWICMDTSVPDVFSAVVRRLASTNSIREKD